MRQVPHYLLIGNGRVAKHFQHYFTLLNLSFSTWHRQQSILQLQHALKHASHVLVLIKDDAIAGFLSDYLIPSNATFVHFSGGLVLETAYGAHPLMTFADELYDLTTYQTIPFIVEENSLSFDELLPGLPNPVARIPKEKKAKYHAMCVLSGNVSCYLWQQLFTFLSTELHLSAEYAFPYLQQQMKNLIQHPENAMTGPIVRGDQKTIEKHLAALTGDGLQAVYQSVVECYQMKQSEVA
jgi:predicted short-subunit dehydrogenase-like oxidoreductase (DUF2520 family)